VNTKKLVLGLTVFLCACAGQAEPRFVTLTLPGTNLVAIGGFGRELVLSEFETAELVCHPRFGFNPGGANAELPYTYLSLLKDGNQYAITLRRGDRQSGELTNSRDVPVVIQGPGTIQFYGQNSNVADFCTFRIEPQNFPPDKTITLPPGTNAFIVTMESSTNLVFWSSATNGVYAPTESAKFFRLKVQRIP
jgi:hypothetical protein